MDGLGIPYEAMAPGVDEHVPPSMPVARRVVYLAHRKAAAVFSRHPDAVVIGSDQLGEVSGAVLEKPPDRDAARAQLSQLRGRTHELHTGICVLGPAFAAEEVDTVRVTLFPVSDSELEAYLDSGEWQGCAGSYRVEGLGQALIAGLDGDRTSVQGLPMLRVVRLLREAGVRLFT